MSFHFNCSCPNVFTTPITAMGCWQCLSLSVVQLNGKHCRKPHCCNGVVDTFGHSYLSVLHHQGTKINCHLNQNNIQVPYTAHTFVKLCSFRRLSHPGTTLRLFSCIHAIAKNPSLSKDRLSFVFSLLLTANVFFS